LRADRQIAEARATVGIEPKYWLLAEEDATVFGYESAGLAILESDCDIGQVHAVVGWGPVAARFVVLMLVGDGDGGTSYETEVFDQREDAQKLVDSLNESPKRARPRSRR
jgi:hypothetical protein